MKSCCNFSWGKLLGKDGSVSAVEKEIQGTADETVAPTMEERAVATHDKNNKIKKLGLDHPPVTLAAKIFCHATEHYRRRQESVPVAHKNKETENKNDDNQVGVVPDQQMLEGHFLWSLCGDADDLEALEIGVVPASTTIQAQQRQSNTTTSGTTTTRYCCTLDPLYQYLKRSLQLTKTEQETLSLSFLHMLASKTARNAFGIRTQSPFKPYYASLLRKYGRDSDAHKSHMQQVAMALSSGSSNNKNTTKLERGMDRLVEEKVAPWITGIFTLTAYMNHSCEPNAMVVSQEFVDAHIDLVAKRDILPGEEILISYIQGVQQQKSTNQRRRELQAKYLFTCGCSKCTSS